MKVGSALIFGTDDHDYFKQVLKEISALKEKLDIFEYSLTNKHQITDTKYSNKANKLKKNLYFLNLDKLKNVA